MMRLSHRDIWPRSLRVAAVCAARLARDLNLGGGNFEIETMKICVLGAGVVGLTSAWWLAEAGHEVVIVDRHTTPGAEASAANGAQLSYGFVAPLASPAMLRKLPSLLMAGEDSIRVSFDLELLRWGIWFLRACSGHAVDETTAVQLASRPLAASSWRD